MSMNILLWLLLLVALLMILSRLMSMEGFTPTQDTIFVSVASYRDVECKTTILDLFAKAEHPDRVFVGVCQQNKCELESCTRFPADFRYAHHVRSKDMAHTAARGPTLARYWCSTLHRGEAWYVQLDSHSLFSPGWDTKLVTMAKVAARTHQTPKIVLSNYPSAIRDEKHPETLVDPSAGVPVLCRSRFNDDGMLSMESVIERPNGQRVPFVSGGMLFAPASVLADVPLDPNLPDLFQGEEILYSARLYTHGYDVYTPTENVVFHHYVRGDSPKFWKDRPDYRKTQLKSLARVKMLLGFEGNSLTKENDPYSPENGTGVTRRLKDYWTFAGVDVEQRSSRSEALFCGQG